ncbi:MAG: hypothetical protein K0M45_08085 [Candidatus Paracaedibacteraceae bacterium]|nr:hypothetical protein [Candidatus Paracaedibacteraceae bacterium]
MKLNRNLFTFITLLCSFIQFSQATDNESVGNLDERIQLYLQQSPQELYNFALKLRDARAIGFSKEDSKEAARLCFQEVLLVTEKTKDENTASKTLWGKAAHNLGNILYNRGHYQDAAKMYIIGKSTGLQASENNLKKLQNLGVLPKAIKPDSEIVQNIHHKQEEVRKKTTDLVRVMDDFEEQFKQLMPQMVLNLVTDLSKINGLEAPNSENLKKDYQTALAKTSKKYADVTEVLNQDFYSQVAENVLMPLQEMKEKAQGSGIDRSDMDSIAYKSLKSQEFTAFEIQKNLFPLSVLTENDEVAKKIKEILLPSTLPIFVGRSCEWIVEHFQRRFPTQSFVKLPGSGLYNIGQLNDELKPIISDEDENHYRDFLGSFNLPKRIFDSQQYNSITLIDRTESGNSIRNIATMLKSINSRFDDSNIHFIGIVDEEKSQNFKFPVIVVSHNTLIQTVKKHSLQQACSLNRAFNVSDWKDWRTFDFYPLPLSPAQARLKQIENFIEQNP